MAKNLFATNDAGSIQLRLSNAVSLEGQVSAKLFFCDDDPPEEDSVTISFVDKDLEEGTTSPMFGVSISVELAEELAGKLSEAVAMHKQRCLAAAKGPQGGPTLVRRKVSQ